MLSFIKGCGFGLMVVFLIGIMMGTPIGFGLWFEAYGMNPWIGVGIGLAIVFILFSGVISVLVDNDVF
jgi:hypothetical protein